MAHSIQERVTRNIAVLRARAERYRRLANELFDPRTSEEATSLAEELDAEIARLETSPEAAGTDRNRTPSGGEDCPGTIFSG